MDHKLVTRVMKFQEISEAMTKSNRLFSMTVHNGDCKREGCDDLEAVVKNFVEETSPELFHFVMDCEVVRKEVEEKEITLEQLMPECTEDFVDQIPIVFFLQPPLRKRDPKTQQAYGKKN